MSRRDYPLSETQTRLLKLLYKFRFATSSLLAGYLGITTRSVNKSLKGLRDKGYLDRHYLASYNIDRKPARYYLSAKGVKHLRPLINVNDGVARSYYKNKSVSETFIEHNLSILQVYLNFSKLYPEQFNILTKAELSNYDEFPPIKPDLFLQNRSSNKSFFLYLYEDTQLFVIQKHIKKLIEHSEEGEWSGTYPDILLACPSPRTEYKMSQWLESLLEDFEFYLTTTKTLLDGSTKEIWTAPAEPEKLIEI